MAPKNNPRFAAIVRDAFTRRGMTQAEVQARGGPSDTTLRRIMDGDDVGIRTRTLFGLDVALGWVPGSAATVLAGGDPTPAPQTIRGVGVPQERNRRDVTPAIGMAATANDATDRSEYAETMIELSFLADDLDDAARSTELYGPITDQDELDRYIDEVEAMRTAAECVTQAVHDAAVAAIGDVNRLRHAKREIRRRNAQGLNIKGYLDGFGAPAVDGSPDDGEPAAAADAAARTTASELEADGGVDGAKEIR